jgi:hypothetical protein
MFPQDGQRATAENSLLAAVARPRQDTGRSRACVRFVPLVHLRHAPRVSCSGSVAVCAALGEEAESYQQPPEQRAGAPAGAPPGWYPDPGGLQALRWWDGAQWSPYTQPLSGAAQEPQLPYPGVAGSASGGYGTFRQERAGGHRQQGGPQDDMAYTPDLASRGPSPASFPPGQPQQPDPYQPQGWPQQQPYAPGPQPRGHRAPRQPGNRKGRRALIGLGTLIGIIVAISVATAHNSPSTGNVAATSTASAAASASAASAAPDCTSQVISWRDNGGLTQLEAVITDMGNVQSSATALGTDLSAGADTSQDQASLQTAAASLQSDSQTAQANLPPSCVPHLRTDEGAALNDASKGALDCQNAVSELGSGNYSVALDDVNASTAAITASGNKFQAATSDVNAFSNG